VSIEEKIRRGKQLISIEKGEGLLRYEEVKRTAAADITSSDGAGTLSSASRTARDRSRRSEKTYREEKLLDAANGEGAEELEWTHARRQRQGRRSGPHVLREMGHLPSSQRRRGSRDLPSASSAAKLAVIKSISRTRHPPLIMTMGDALKNDEAQHPRDP